MFWSEKISKATPATFLTKGDKKHVCRSAIMDVGLDMPDPGQVPEGSKCGDSRVIYTQVNHVNHVIVLNYEFYPYSLMLQTVILMLWFHGSMLT